MTVEEQIVVFEHNAEHERKEGDLNNCLHFRQLVEWLKDYKRLLEQDPCGDCISRESIIEIVNHQRFGMSKLAFGIIAEKVKELPSVTPQPKMGRWIMSDDGLYRPICNNCGGHPWKGYIPTVEEATEVFKYCPNCGYAMQEVEE